MNFSTNTHWSKFEDDFKMTINKSIIIMNEWEKGSEITKRRLEKHRSEIEAFACHCMEELEKEIISELKQR